MMGIFIAFLVLRAIIAYYQDIQGQFQTGDKVPIAGVFCLVSPVCPSDNFQ